VVGKATAATGCLVRSCEAMQSRTCFYIAPLLTPRKRIKHGRRSQLQTVSACKFFQGRRMQEFRAAGFFGLLRPERIAASDWNAQNRRPYRARNRTQWVPCQAPLQQHGVSRCSQTHLGKSRPKLTVDIMMSSLRSSRCANHSFP